MSNQNITLNIPEMHCESCPKLIKITLLEINGIDEVSASLDTKTVVVTFDPKKISIASIISSIDEIGYTASLK